MWYAGVGSRQTPIIVVKRMIEIAEELSELGYTLRSGGADGADTAFEKGCDAVSGEKEIYLPWAGFNNSKSELYDCYNLMHLVTAQRTYGPQWNRIRGPVKKLMTRNVAQVMGLDDREVAYSEFVVCWTPDGCESTSKRTRVTGGTGQCIAVANDLRIPVYNMFNDNFEERLKQHLYRRTLFEN